MLFFCKIARKSFSVYPPSETLLAMKQIFLSYLWTRSYTTNFASCKRSPTIRVQSNELMTKTRIEFYLGYVYMVPVPSGSKSDRIGLLFTSGERSAGPERFRIPSLPANVNTGHLERTQQRTVHEVSTTDRRHIENCISL